MTAPPSVLHVVPRFHDGGPTESILGHERRAAARAAHVPAQIMALEPGGSSRMVMQAMRQRVRLHIAPDPERESELLATADVVVVHWWNTPSMWSFLQRHRGLPLRWVLQVEVNGQQQPQVLPAALARAPVHLVLTSPHCEGLRSDGAVSVIPAIAEPATAPTVTAGRRSGSLVHVGTVNVMKLDPALIDVHVAAFDQGAHLTVVGSGGDEERFTARAEELGVADRVRFTGFVADFDDLVAGAAAFTAPSSSVSYGSCDKTVQAALLSGTPVLVYRDAPIAWLVDHGVTGWLAEDRRHFADLAAAVATGDCALPADEVAAVARNRFDADRAADALDRVVGETADAPPRPLRDGSADLEDWLALQIGTGEPMPVADLTASLEPARRPDLVDLITDDPLLRAHARWGCEGGLAQFLQQRPESLR